MQKLDDYLMKKLQNKQHAEEYINAALEEFFEDYNKELFLVSLSDVIRANGGYSKIAKEASINRQHMYKALSSSGNPTLELICAVLSAIGFTLKVEHT